MAGNKVTVQEEKSPKISFGRRADGADRAAHPWTTFPGSQREGEHKSERRSFKASVQI